MVFGGAGLPAWTGPLRWIPPMGAGGSALATSLVQIGEVLLLAWVIRQIPVPARPADLHRRLPDDERRILRVGVPIGLHFGAEVGVFALAGFLAGRLGAESLAAHQIALTFSSVTFTFALGIGNAGSVRVGLAVGARDTPGARRAGLLAFGAGAAFMGCAAVTYLLFPGAIVATMTNAPAIAALAVPLFGVAAVFQVSDGVQGVGAGVLRGAGDSRFTFTANVVGHYLIGLPLALLLGFHLGWGVLGIWWGLAAGLTAVAVALVWRFLRVSGRRSSRSHCPRPDRGAQGARREAPGARGSGFGRRCLEGGHRHGLAARLRRRASQHLVLHPPAEQPPQRDEPDAGEEEVVAGHPPRGRLDPPAEQVERRREHRPHHGELGGGPAAELQKLPERLEANRAVGLHVVRLERPEQEPAECEEDPVQTGPARAGASVCGGRRAGHARRRTARVLGPSLPMAGRSTRSLPVSAAGGP